MLLKDVKLKNSDQNDDNSPYYYRGRELEIITDQGRFSTPSKIISKSEHNARNEIPISTALSLELAIDFKLFNTDQMTSFLKENGSITKNIRNTRQFNQMTRRSIFKISIFQPFKKVLNNLSLKQKMKFVELQADFLQLKLGTNIITYPYLHLGYSDYIDFINKYYPKNDKISAIFTLDMSMPEDSFQEVLKHIVEKPGPKIIAIIYQEWENYPLQHYAINSYFDNEDVAFIACQVTRELELTNVNKLHSVQFDAFDLIALKQSNSFPPEPEIDLSRVKFLSSSTLEVDNIANVIEDQKRDLVGEFKIPANNVNDIHQLDNIVHDYSTDLTDPVKFNTLIYLAKMHEAVISPPEFDVSREFIHSGETDEYIKQKKGLQRVSFLKKR